MATNHDGGNSDAVSPQRQSASDIAGNEIVSAITTAESFRRFILGNYVGTLPAVKWNECDGNILSVLGTLGRAWRRTDADVASRVAELSNFACSGYFQNGSEPTRAELSRRAQADGWGYDELLSLCISLSTLDCDEDEDEDCDEDWDCDDDDEDSDE